ncbi:MAG: 50S ribosomal protein L4 [Candidatus Omnitrophica bacterium]|nr:50S ribosomal protein L4 [Candidatus Omnitrophota bacterium]
MKSVSIHDPKGKAAGKLTLELDYFDGKINKALLHQVVTMYLANKRKGSASTKTRGQIRGGGRKPWRQKGTGRARVGSNRNPVWRGGGVVFGPHPRQYGYSLPSTIRNKALKQSLNGKLEDKQLLIIDEFPQQLQKTKQFAKLLSALKATDKPLVVTAKHNPDIQRTARNIPGVTVKAFNNINAYDVLRHHKVLFSKQALENLIKLRKR